MRTRLSFLVVVVSLLLPAGVRASGHWYSMAAAPSAHTDQSTLWGGNVSAEKALPNKSRWTGFADLGAHAGEHGTSTLTQRSLLIGGRYSLPRRYRSPAAGFEYHALQPFAHVMGGGIWSKDQPANGYQGDWAVGVGVGADLLFSKFGGLRGQVDHVWLWREQGRDGLFRISLGVTYRFEHP